MDAVLLNGVKRAADEFVKADVFIHNLADERGVRAVFQQAAHQIGEQGFVCAHGGIHTAAFAEVLRADDLVV